MTTPGASDTVSITVTLFAELRQYLPEGADGAFAQELARDTTVEMLLSKLGVPSEVEITVGLNGELGARDNELKDGDDLQLFTPMQGG